jgi:hypothetical protein
MISLWLSGRAPDWSAGVCDEASEGQQENARECFMAGFGGVDVFGV